MDSTFAASSTNPELMGAKLRFTIFSLFTGPELEIEISTKY